MAKWPLNPSKIRDAWKEVMHAADVPAWLVLGGDPALVDKAQRRFGGGEAAPRLWQGSLSRDDRPMLGAGEILVFFVQPAEHERAKSLLGEADLPLGAVLVVDDGVAATFEIVWHGLNVAHVSFAEGVRGWEKVCEAILDVASEHVVPLARRYPALRAEASRRVVGRTSRQNGVVGAAFFIPGTDFPVMTVNQIKMVLSLAAIYGQDLSQERALEIAGVVGMGFAFRAVARQAVDFVPGPGWALKGAIGYSGTRVMGEAVVKYFEEGAPATPSRLVGLARRLRR